MYISEKDIEHFKTTEYFTVAWKDCVRRFMKLPIELKLWSYQYKGGCKIDAFILVLYFHSLTILRDRNRIKVDENRNSIEFRVLSNSMTNFLSLYV